MTDREPAPLRPLGLVIRTDGAARGNPGPAACGAVLIDASRPDAHDPDAPPLAVVASPLGIRTNNVAEYAGLVLALRVAVHLQAQEVELLLDSKLIVEQLNGRWRLRDPKLRGLYDEARRTLAGFRRWSAVHEPRLRNRAADALANLALDDPEAAARRVAEVAATSGCPHYQAVLASTHGDPRPVDRALRAARAAGATPASTTTAPREIV